MARQGSNNDIRSHDIDDRGAHRDNPGPDGDRDAHLAPAGPHRPLSLSRSAFYRAAVGA